jgi:nucleoside phosphorylase
MGHGKEIAHPPDARRKRETTLVHVGNIASGDTLVKDPVMRDQIRDRFKARAIEMEAVGLRDAVWSRAGELVVVRGIVDYCDGFKSDNWHLMAATKAASVTYLLFSTLMRAEGEGSGFASV